MPKPRPKSKAAQPAAKPTALYVLSDSTGGLARHMVTMFLTQFPHGAFAMQMKPFLREPSRLARAMEAMRRRPGIVFHAVVSVELKQKIADECKRLKSPCCDLTGPSVEFLARASGLSPVADHQRLHKLDHGYNQRINAMSFTLAHDDGLGLESLDDAEIVLTGVSRTGKTPTSVFLAMMGFRVANISLAMGVEPPAELTGLPPGKLIGLVIDPSRLAEIRGRRQTAWHMAPTDYSQTDHIGEEIGWSRRLFTKLGCPILDVTNQAIEETSARVLDLLGLQQPAPMSDEGLE